MKNLKMIFLDIDGTLTNNNNVITDKLIKTIKKFQDKKIDVVLTSGRSYIYTENICKMIKASDYIIAGNGAIIKNYKTNKVILKKCIPKSTIKEILKYCKTHNCELIVNEEDIDYQINQQKQINKNIYQLELRSTNYERMKIIKSYFKDIIPRIEITNSSKALIENKRIKNKVYFHNLCAKNVSKGNAVLELLDYLNIDINDVICVGDSDNDISMAIVCDNFVAMGNSTSNLKKYTSMIIKTNEEDGLYEYLNNLYKQI